VVTHSHQVKELIGYFPERVSVYPELSVYSFLDFVAEAKGVPRLERKHAIQEVIEACGLEQVRKRIIGHLSKGYRQRVGIAQALMHKPQVLILDEPTIGLDPAQVVEIRNLIRDLGKERTVILSTHILSEVSDVCDRVIIMHQGRILAAESVASLRTQLHHTRHVHIEIEAINSNQASRLQKALESLPGVIQVQKVQEVQAVPAKDTETGEESARNPPPLSRTWLVEHQDGDIRAAISRTVLDHDCGLLEVHSLEPTLEALYLQLIRDAQTV
jgi:ABC-2 type transport system ATP-binding protein